MRVYIKKSCLISILLSFPLVVLAESIPESAVPTAKTGLFYKCTGIEEIIFQDIPCDFGQKQEIIKIQLKKSTSNIETDKYISNSAQDLDEVDLYNQEPKNLDPKELERIKEEITPPSTESGALDPESNLQHRDGVRNIEY